MSPRYLSDNSDRRPVRRTLRRRTFLAATGAASSVAIAGCSGSDGSNSPTSDSPFPAGSCLGAAVESLPEPAYGFEFADGVAPEVGDAEASSDGDVTVSDGVATFGSGGGEIRVSGAPVPDEFTVSLFARPAVEAPDQWNVMVWYSPSGAQYAGWGVEHGKGAVDFWVEGPGGADTEVLTTSDSPPAVGEWTHVVGVKRGSETALYVDGEQVGSSSLSFEDIDYADQDGVELVLGRHAGSGVGDRHYRGDLDSVGLWTEALAESQLEALFEAASSCR
jgi:hypothetical protein